MIAANTSWPGTTVSTVCSHVSLNPPSAPSQLRPQMVSTRLTQSGSHVKLQQKMSSSQICCTQLVSAGGESQP